MNFSLLYRYFDASWILVAFVAFHIHSAFETGGNKDQLRHAVWIHFKRFHKSLIPSLVGQIGMLSMWAHSSGVVPFIIMVEGLFPLNTELCEIYFQLKKYRSPF